MRKAEYLFGTPLQMDKVAAASVSFITDHERSLLIMGPGGHSPAHQVESYMVGT
jgi:hypothetical protein